MAYLYCSELNQSAMNYFKWKLFNLEQYNVWICHWSSVIMLFLVYINDITENIDLHVKHFADVTASLLLLIQMNRNRDLIKTET